MNKYNKIMEHIEVTEEMKKRILNNALQSSNSNFSKKKNSPFQYKNIKYLVASVAILLIGISTTLYNQNPPMVTSINNQNSIILSIEELSKAVEFKIKNIKSLEEKSSSIDYILISDSIAEIEYIVDNQSYIYHISKDADEEYSFPTITETIVIDDVEVRISEKQNMVSFAIWTSDNTTYSILTSEPITKTEMVGLINEALE